MKYFSVLMLSVLLVSCWENSNNDVISNSNNLNIDKDTLIDTDLESTETEVIEVETQRVKTDAELKYPDRFDPVTWASIPKPM